jgi:hypothetical protein
VSKHERVQEFQQSVAPTRPSDDAFQQQDHFFGFTTDQWLLVVVEFKLIDNPERMLENGAESR